MATATCSCPPALPKYPRARWWRSPAIDPLIAGHSILKAHARRREPAGVLKKNRWLHSSAKNSRITNLRWRPTFRFWRSDEAGKVLRRPEPLQPMRLALEWVDRPLASLRDEI